MNPPRAHRASPLPRKNPYKLGWVQALSLYPGLAILFVTGVYLGIAELDGERLDLWMLQVHGYAVPVFLLSFGALLAKHVPAAWKANRNRWSGAVVVGVCAFLVITGAMLYYVGSDFLREKTKEFHYGVGILLAPLLIFHAVAGLWERRKHEKKH